MDVETFLSSLLEALGDRPFVLSVDLETEAFVVKGRQNDLLPGPDQELGVGCNSALSDRDTSRSNKSGSLRGDVEIAARVLICLCPSSLTE
jgi:hypothetical protein